ncbi:hypothetical protein F4819DRAFT_134668 [Hypoxylon fuscum]|nr:hypothetical protein F4819DRAFT_134668 [Hypoxylon fuscum]
MDFNDTPNYRGHTEIGLSAWLIGFSTLFYGLRLVVRVSMTKSPGLDDGIAGIAYLLLLTHSIIDIHSVSFGSGAHMDTIPEDLASKFFVSLGIETLIYFWAVAMVRFAILAFLPRLTQDKSIIWISWTVAVVIIAQTVTAFVYRLTECTPAIDVFKPPKTPGLQCVGVAANNMMLVGHGVAGIVIDAALLLLPIWVIWSKMMWSRKTLQIIMILSVGMFAVVTGIIRVVLMRTMDFSNDITYKMPSLGIWTNLEGHVGLWCGCFPALQPLLRIMPGKIRRSTTNSNGNYTTFKQGTQSRLSRVNEGYHRTGSSAGDVDNDSQRELFLLEMLKTDATKRDRGRDVSAA